ncbi:twinfilin-1-like isoform X2 [Mytilus galloprovincialis]|uniref:twinfilin-1-like isoform X2 n=1 Tax=Mytilus galloprovincialis TaxID=29158 RepID=UPI003F7BC74E
MSHQTGITAGKELLEYFATCKEGHVRLIKIGIVNEELVLQDSKDVDGTWEDDIDKFVLPALEEKQPCYILYRLDSKNNLGYQFIFICWSPDFSPIKEKMLYAGTKVTLKQEFGGGLIHDEMFGTEKADISLNGYKKHVVAQHAPAPLTEAEEEKQHIKRTEINTASVDTKMQTISGVAFPISQQALNKIEALGQGQFNYLQLSLDLSKEIVNFEEAENVNVGDLQAHVPTDHGRYHLYNFKHTHEGDYMENIVFIYSMPGYKCSIKERMLYSSCKAPFIDNVQQLGLEVVKNIEIDDPKELTETYIYDEVHPKKNVARQAFAKPKGPAGRGPRRMQPKQES